LYPFIHYLLPNEIDDNIIYIDFLSYLVFPCALHPAP
jgi:hypothetical protein